MKRILFLFSLTFLVNPMVGQTNYYVSTSGNNANSGSFSSPWATFQYAANQVAPGDTVFLRGGTYNEKVEVGVSGTSGSPIVFMNYQDETPVIDGSGLSFIDGYGILTIYQIAYISVLGLKFSNSGTHNNNGGVLVQESSHVVIKNCKTYETKSSGIGVWDCANIIIEGNDIELACNGGEQECLTIAETDHFEVLKNKVHHGGIDLNGGEGIDIKQGCSNGKVYENEVYDIKAVGIYIDAYDLTQANIEVYNNKVHHIDKGLGGDQGIGIMLAAEDGGVLQNVSIFNNLIYECALFGFNISDCCTASHVVKDVLVINNTIYKNGYNADIDGGGIIFDNLQIQNITLRNNIVSQNNLFQIGISDSSQLSELTIDHNLIDGYNGLPGEVTGSQSVLASAGFMNAGNEDFHLSMTSSAIDNGASNQAPTYDLDYVGRPFGSNVDIGAYEYTFLSDNGVEEDHSRIDITTFPNPVRDKLNVTIAGEEMDGEIALIIYDLSGKTVLQRTLSNGFNTISGLSQFDQGVYLIRISVQNHDIYHSLFLKRL